MLLRIGVDKHGVSRYSGMAEGIMSLVNVLTIPLVSCPPLGLAARKFLGVRDQSDISR